MAYGPGVPGTHDVYRTIDDCYRVVHMEGMPISTLQKPKRQGGWGLIDIEAKCRVLLIGRMWTQNMKKSSATSTWLREWNLDGPMANPLT